MHTYTFLKMRKRSVTCGAFFNALQLIYRKKKKPLLKRILDGSRKFQTPHRLIKIWQHKIKNKGDLKGRQSKPLFLFLVLPKYFGDGKLNSSELSFNPVEYTSFARRETGKCAFLF